MTARILVVEDHAIVREPLARLLRHEGYETECATNGIDALAATRNRTPDLILLDMMMPKMDGIAFLRNIRSNDATAHIAVIVLTGLVESSATACIRELGVQELWQKAAFNVSDLLERIERCIAATWVQRQRDFESERIEMNDESWSQH